jgi:peptidoglycan-N-acetylglucosamine deacetylase
MLKYQKIVLLFLALFLVAIASNLFFNIGLWLYFLIPAMLVLFLAFGAINMRSRYYLDSYSRADTMEKIIALTFDDGPDERNTRVILKILKKYNIRATFFCIGHKAEISSGLVKEIDNGDHTVGSHSYSHHFFFDLFSSGKMKDDLLRCDKILNEILKKKIRMFRPPYGVTNPTLAGALKKFNYSVIGWSLKSKDTILNEEDLLKRLMKKLKPGDIILFHDTKPETVAILEKFILFAIENNFKFERADKLLNIEPYA